MASLSDAVHWIATHFEPQIAAEPALDRIHEHLVSDSAIQLTSALWGTPPSLIAVRVLKAAGRKIPRGWLDRDQVTGIYASRAILLERVWLLMRNHRLISEIAREVGVCISEVNRICETNEGRPSDFVISPHHRGRTRRGLLHR